MRAIIFTEAPLAGNERLRSVVLAESLALVREGLAALCEATSRYKVVGQCGDGAAAWRMIEVFRPELAVLDSDLPKLFPLEVVRRVQAAEIPTKTILLSTRCDRKTVIEALRAGVHAYILKSGPSHHLLEAFQQVQDGGIYVSPMLEPDKLFNPRREKAVGDPFEALSAREHQVFSLLVEGLRAKEIAGRLELSAKTVDTYRANLMRKLDIHDVAGLVKFAIQRNLTSAR